MDFSRRKLPEYSGWTLASTNYGIGFAHYNKVSENFERIHLAYLFQSSATRVLHWQPLPPPCEGDIDPNGKDFQQKVVI